MRPIGPGWRVGVWPPMVKVSSPSRSRPICSCGWLCGCTTARGANSTSESIIFSPAAVKIWTPGKISWWEQSGRETKYDMEMASQLLSDSEQAVVFGKAFAAGDGTDLDMVGGGGDGEVGQEIVFGFA